MSEPRRFARRVCRAVGALCAVVVMSAGAGAAENLLPHGDFEQADEEGFARGWRAHNWGGEGSLGRSTRTAEAARGGGWSLRAESRDGVARYGALTRLRLDPGRHVLRFFARTEPGRTALVRAYLAERYSPVFLVTDEWTPFEFRHTIERPRIAAEMNIQNFAHAPVVVWFDDVRLERAPDLRVEVVPDPRPITQQPRLLYGSAHLGHVGATAGDWAGRGFAGFLLGHLLPDWAVNVWAQDGKPETAGPDDGLSAETREAQRACVEAGLTENGLKTALDTPLPDPFDDEGYRRLTENLRQGARFAREVGLGMIALDTKPALRQWDYDWPGYDLKQHTRAALAAQMRERWRVVGEMMARSHPQADLALTPEGMVYYGPLWMEMLGGLLEGLADGGGEGRVHVLCQGTFLVLRPEEIRDHALSVRALAEGRLTGRAREVWRERGGIALGAWPLGYYRALKGPGGRTRGWSGREESFGDNAVGAFADKSARYSPEELRVQLAALRAFSNGYVWVYGHGSSWWQVTEEQADRYAKRTEPFPRGNYLVPTVPDVAAYYRVAAERRIVILKEDEQ